MRYIAINQYGEITWLKTEHPRKELLGMFDRKHASKMYVDKKDGGTKHIGYIIAGYWLTVYKVERMEKSA